MLYLETVSPALLKIIQAVSSEPMFREFRLVGGTALSLYLGHRLSVDADFFSENPFDKREAEAKLLHRLPGFVIMKESPHGFAGVYEGVKLDLYTWNVPFLLPPIESDGMRLAAIPDIVALKLDAIINRKEEKDFRDVHALLSVYPLSELLEFYHERIPHRDLRLVIDHLAAAPAADRQQPVVLLKNVDYATVAEDILQAIRNHLADLKSTQTRLAEARLQQRLEEIKKKKQ
ncbi:MAG: nucleotidyl transferase AbiEii/AbiGii toxin family protein [Saprospiraceae bacterium]